MPIYEYSCSDCKTNFELIRDYSKADDPADCTECGSTHTHRVISKCFSSNSSGGSNSSGCSSCSGGSCSSCGH